MLKPPAAMTLYCLLCICFAALPKIKADASQLVTSGNGFVYDAPAASSFDLTQIEDEPPTAVASTSARHYEEFEIEPATSFAVTLDKSSGLSSAYRYSQPQHIEREMQPTVFVTPAPPAAAAPLVPSPTVQYTEEQIHQHHNAAQPSHHYTASHRAQHAASQYDSHYAPHEKRNHNAVTPGGYHKAETKVHQAESHSSNRYLPATTHHHENHSEHQNHRTNYHYHATNYKATQHTQHTAPYSSSSRFKTSAENHAAHHETRHNHGPHLTARYSPIDPSGPLFVTPLPATDFNHRSEKISAFVPITPPPSYRHRFVTSERHAHNFRKVRSKGYIYDVPSSEFNE